MSDYQDRGKPHGRHSPSLDKGANGRAGGAPGKRTPVESPTRITETAETLERTEAIESKTEPTSESMDRAVVGGDEVPYRVEMEQAFGQDFGSVRTKVGAGAALGDIGAIGAARGEEIAFASPSPDRAVVAHELAHVVQRWRAGSINPSTQLEDGSSRAEQEAELVGVRVAAGERAPQITQFPPGSSRARPRADRLRRLRRSMPARGSITCWCCRRCGPMSPASSSPPG